MKSKFLIDGPPPTISGELHMGHAMSYSHMDYMARFMKSEGKELVYPFGYDNNGLPTEKLAQKNGCLDQQKIIDFSNAWAQEKYIPAFKKLGMAYDFERAYGTFDPKVCALANLSFEDLKQKGLLYRANRKFFYCPKMKVSVSQSEIDDSGRYERSGEKVEIRTGEGYFIRMKDNLPDLRKAVNSIKWHHDHFRERLLVWMDGINQDWSISRERNFGIPIPGETGLVFDTWFTSSLSPQMSWMAYTDELSLACPIFDARYQAHDIVRTWALFTIVKSLYHNDQIPWENIIISGHAVDKNGRKLSKTEGNYKELDYYLKQYGQSGLRYWASISGSGVETRIDEQGMLQGKKLVNKLRNAKRYLDMQDTDGINTSHIDRWAEVHGSIKNRLYSYEWWHAIRELRDFFWYTFCDVWIEDNKTTPSTETLREILAEIISCFSVFMPTLSEEISS